MRSTLLCVLAAALPFTGCTTPTRHSSTQEMKAIERSRLAYHKQHARFEVPASSLPAFQKQEFRKLARRQSLSRANGTRLELILGKRQQTGVSGIYRTASQYRLSDPGGKLLAQAESTLALPDLGPDAHTTIVLLSDSIRPVWLIAEEQSWATQRYILLKPALKPPGNEQVWEATYVRIPIHNTAELSGLFPKLLGLHAGRIFLEFDGHIYSFPIEILPQETRLEYSIG